MSKVILVARILLGLIFVVFSVGGFLGLLPEPELNEAAGSFMAALVATGYMMPLIKATELVGGLMVLTGFRLPLGLVLLAPVVVNIALFHLVLDRAGLPIALLVVALEALVAWGYRDSFRQLLSGGGAPSA